MAQFQPGQSGNPTGRPKGLRDKKSQALDGLLSEEDREAIIRKIVEKAKEGDTTAAATILDRCWPRLRAQAATVQIDLSGAETLVAKAETIADAVASGRLPADIGGDLLQALAAIAQLQKFTELDQRLAQLEESLNAKL